MRPSSINDHDASVAYAFGIDTQGTDWVDAIRYFRGMGRSRRRGTERIVFALCLVVLTVLTVFATIDQFA